MNEITSVNVDIGSDVDVRLCGQMWNNIQKQQSALPWLGQAEQYLAGVVPTEIAEVYVELLRSVVGGVYANGWRQCPYENARWWISVLERRIAELRTAVQPMTN